MDDTDGDGGDCDDDMTGPRDVDGVIDDDDDDNDVGMTDDWVELICHNGDSGFCNEEKSIKKDAKWIFSKKFTNFVQNPRNKKIWALFRTINFMSADEGATPLLSSLLIWDKQRLLESLWYNNRFRYFNRLSFSQMHFILFVHFRFLFIVIWFQYGFNRLNKQLSDNKAILFDVGG